MGVPYSTGTPQSPSQNDATGSITPSNKSSQTPQAAAQNIPQGTNMRGGKAVISGRGPTRQNGKLGKPSFR